MYHNASFLNYTRMEAEKTRRRELARAKKQFPKISTKDGQEYKIGDIIGDGSNATVYSLEPVYTIESDLSYIKKFRKLLEILKKMQQTEKYPKIIKIFKTISDNFPIETEQKALSVIYTAEIVEVFGRKAIVSDRVPGDDLQKILSTPGGDNFSFLDKVVIAHQLARILAIFHKKISDDGIMITHGDIKLENVVIDKRNKDRDKDAVPICNLIDFGFAKKSEGLDHLSDIDTIYGTYGYIAPETYLHKKIGPPSDIYAFASFMCALFFDNQYPGGEQVVAYPDQLLKDQSLVGDYNKEKMIMPDLKDVFRHFLANMLDMNISNRANIIVVENFLYSLEKLCILCSFNDSGPYQAQIDLNIIRLRLLTLYPKIKESDIPEGLGDISEDHRKLLKKTISGFDQVASHKEILSNYTKLIGLENIPALAEKPKKILRAEKAVQIAAILSAKQDSILGYPR